MRTKRWLAFLTAVAMAAALAGCGGQQGASSESPEKKATEEVQESAPATEGDDAEQTEPVKLSIMLNNVNEVPEGSISDQWASQLEEKLNLEFEWVIPPASAYVENLQLALINEDKPDVFFFPSESADYYIEACENGMFYDISGMLDDYPNVKAHTAQISWNALDLFHDGRIWGIPRSTVCRADGFFLRADWLDNLQIDYKEGDFLPLNDFFDILYAFTYDDPDQNGLDDTWGLKAFAMDSGSLNTGLPRIFHIGSGTPWYEMPDGTLTCLKFSKDYDYYKQYLEFANKCWKAGVMEPDAFAIDSATSRERNAQYGCLPEFPGNMKTFEETNNCTYVYCPGVVLDNDPIEGYTYGDQTNGIWGLYAISSTCEHPEKFLELADYVLSDEQWVNLSAKNLIDVGFTVDAEGNYDFSMFDALKEEDKKNGTSLASNALISGFLRRADGVEFFVSRTDSPEEQKRITDLIQITFDRYWSTVDGGYKPQIATDPTFIEYQNYMSQEEAKIITGDKPVEYWDELLEGCYEAGYAEYAEEMTAFIEGQK